MKDYIIRGTAANNSIRVFAATTKEMVEHARQVHNTTPVATAALGRLMTAGAMMGAMLKGDKDILTLQIKGNGPIGGIVVTVDSKSNVKGYVYNPYVDIPLKSNKKLDVSSALGIGILNIIKDIGLKDPYIGQTHLVSGEIAEDLTYYFANSEQKPSSVALGVLIDRDYTVKQSGGFIIQLMPDIDEETIKQLEDNLSKMPPITTLLDEGKTPEDIINIVLGSMGVQILDTIDTKFHCNCSRERVEKALISVGRKDIQEMIDEGKPVELNCHFCNKKYEVTIDGLKGMLSES
jgi:molecular chaperone Hsp33